MFRLVAVNTIARAPSEATIRVRRVVVWRATRKSAAPAISPTRNCGDRDERRGHTVAWPEDVRRGRRRVRRAGARTDEVRPGEHRDNQDGGRREDGRRGETLNGDAEPRRRAVGRDHGPDARPESPPEPVRGPGT